MTNFDSLSITNQAYYILKNHTTVRATARAFGIPKSTIHHNLTKKLKHINFKLYQQVKILMIENFNIKHIHGGESTKLKYEKF